jgi:hypothetical protein
MEQPQDYKNVDEYHSLVSSGDIESLSGPELTKILEDIRQKRLKSFEEKPRSKTPRGSTPTVKVTAEKKQEAQSIISDLGL